MFEEQIKECDDKIVILKRLKRKYESEQRIVIAERKAQCDKVRRVWVKDKQSMMLSYLQAHGTDLTDLYAAALKYHAEA